MQINKGMQINREKKWKVQAFTCVQDADNQKEFSKVKLYKRKENTGRERH